jgi:hypothetical protein
MLERYRVGGSGRTQQDRIGDAAESRELERRISAMTVAVRDRQRAEIGVLGAASIPQDRILSQSAGKGPGPVLR